MVSFGRCTAEFATGRGGVHRTSRGTATVRAQPRSPGTAGGRTGDLSSRHAGRIRFGMRETSGGAVARAMGRIAIGRRVGLAGALTALSLGIVLLAHQNASLEARLSRDEARGDELSALVTEYSRHALPREEFDKLRSRLERGLSSTVRRVGAIEARSNAGALVIAAASRSVVFLQGAYGFVEKGTGRPLRHVVGPDGRPISTSRGPAVGLDGAGPLVEVRFTGTAFVATRDRLLLTNRHVAVPWEADTAAGALVDKELVPVMHRFVGYLPGTQEPFAVRLRIAGDDADVAVLHSDGLPVDAPYLELATTPARPGEDVIVMGYPTGIRALLARIQPQFLEELKAEKEADFWSIGRRLSKAGHISPLATRGIVGQITAAAVVYDAETAQGGSGGPVLGLDGRVLAINAAVLPEFNGSNIGVPAEAARRVLAPTRRHSGAWTPVGSQPRSSAADTPEDAASKRQPPGAMTH